MHAEPVMMFKCHCRDCQHVTGGGFVPECSALSAFRLTKGECAHHFHAKSGRRQHNGSVPNAVLDHRWPSDQRPNEFIGITAGSLDDPSWFHADGFLCRTRNRGIEWTRRFREFDTIHRHRNKNRPLAG